MIFSYIKFTEELTFSKNKINDDLFFGSDIYRFSCNYATKTTTNKEHYKVEVRLRELEVEGKWEDVGRALGGKEVEEFVTWDNTMTLSFFDNDQFANKINPESMLVGDMVNLKINWIENFVPQFPVVFYASVCTVETLDGSKSYDLVNNGCMSNLVSMTQHSEKFSSQTLKFSYQSFSFTRTRGAFDLSLFCTLDFCLKDGESQECGGAPTACKSGYSL